MSVEALAARVHDVRAGLELNDYQVKNSSGDLYNELSHTWVATAYAGGEFEIAWWFRPTGTGLNGAGPMARNTVRINESLLEAHPGYFSEVVDAIVHGLPYVGPGLRGAL